jgi:hypothetical protein
MSDAYAKGQMLVYRKEGQEDQVVRCEAIHRDDMPNLYYTIKFSDGREKQTDHKNLIPAEVPDDETKAPALPSLSFSSWESTKISALNSAGKRHLGSELSYLGGKSGVAQNLNGPITTLDNLMQNRDQTLILCRDEKGKAIGYLKYGSKDLYFYDPKGKTHQCKDVLCLLDFYVEDSVQRRGAGRALFDEMLSQLAGLLPQYIAYDRPSPKLIAFMAKHFNLTKPDLQPNRYAIFEGHDFFSR